MTGAKYAWASNATSDDDVKLAAQEFLDWVAQPEQPAAFAELSGAIPIAGIDAATLSPSYEPIGELLSSGSYTGVPNAAGRTPPCTTPSASACRAC